MRRFLYQASFALGIVVFFLFSFTTVANAAPGSCTGGWSRTCTACYNNLRLCYYECENALGEDFFVVWEACGTTTPTPPPQPPPPTCGNGNIDAGEDCANCSVDVGACPGEPVGCSICGNSGGGGCGN